MLGRRQLEPLPFTPHVPPNCLTFPGLIRSGAKSGAVPVAREQRKLAAILTADVVGYSRLMARDESGRWYAVGGGHRHHSVPVCASAVPTPGESPPPVRADGNAGAPTVPKALRLRT